MSSCHVCIVVGLMVNVCVHSGGAHGQDSCPEIIETQFRELLIQQGGAVDGMMLLRQIKERNSSYHGLLVFGHMVD